MGQDRSNSRLHLRDGHSSRLSKDITTNHLDFAAAGKRGPIESMLQSSGCTQLHFQHPRVKGTTTFSCLVNSSSTTTARSQAHHRSSSHPSSTTSSSSSSSGSGLLLQHAKATGRQTLNRCAVVTRAWFGQQQQQQLWDYSGSNVKQMSLRELELLHRLSFGHRNQRSYLVVLYKPRTPACQAFEAEVERLASGLRHEPAFVASALDVSSSEAATFVSNMLKVDSVPSVLLYPEAARGCLKFLGPDMSAVGMLAAINKARKTALPGTATSPGAAEWRLIEAATPLSVTALRAAAASGDRETVVAALQQQMQPIQPTPLAFQQASSYWSQGKVQLWGGLLLCSLLFLAWDLKLSDLWEDWNLTRRQAARQQGRKFTPQENLDDIVTYMMKSLTGQMPQQQQQQQGHEQQQLLAASQLQQQEGSVDPQKQQSAILHSIQAPADTSAAMKHSEMQHTSDSDATGALNSRRPADGQQQQLDALNPPNKRDVSRK